MRSQILEFCAEEAHTVPGDRARNRPAQHEAMFWVMGMRRYGWIRELKDVTPEGYFRYLAVPAEGRA